MKAATRRRRQLAKVEQWLEKARPDLERRFVSDNGWPEFSLLIAMEQLVVYLNMLEDGEETIKKKGGTGIDVS